MPRIGSLSGSRSTVTRSCRCTSRSFPSRAPGPGGPDAPKAAKWRKLIPHRDQSAVVRSDGRDPRGESAVVLEQEGVSAAREQRQRRAADPPGHEARVLRRRDDALAAINGPRQPTRARPRPLRAGTLPLLSRMGHRFLYSAESPFCGNRTRGRPGHEAPTLRKPPRGGNGITAASVPARHGNIRIRTSPAARAIRRLEGVERGVLGYASAAGFRADWHGAAPAVAEPEVRTFLRRRGSRSERRAARSHPASAVQPWPPRQDPSCSSPTPPAY